MERIIVKAAALLNLKISFAVSTREILFIACIGVVLGLGFSPAAALLTGILIAQFIGHPYVHLNHKATRILLQISVVGLGFGMNIHSAIAAGREGILFAAASITGTLLLGWVAGRLMRTDWKSSWLIACGTAICGGSAIAAISPVIRAKESQVSVAMGTIFLLNAIALFIFPPIGHMLGLSQEQFGLWSAIAIQDTSSVVGAASKYGPEALQVATTIKLARALWIIPVALITAIMVNRGQLKREEQRRQELQQEGVHDMQPGNAGNKTARARISIPWFIGLFILAMIANTYIPILHTVSAPIARISKTGLTLTLFLIGAGLSRAAIKAAGIKPLLQGSILWIILSAAALLSIWRLA